MKENQKLKKSTPFFINLSKKQNSISPKKQLQAGIILSYH